MASALSGWRCHCGVKEKLFQKLNLEKALAEFTAAASDRPAHHQLCMEMFVDNDWRTILARTKNAQ